MRKRYQTINALFCAITIRQWATGVFSVCFCVCFVYSVWRFVFSIKSLLLSVLLLMKRNLSNSVIIAVVNITFERDLFGSYR